ncbi:hypothetical protein [Acrocarpospora corrugata]|uniref:hypothetical protein n=1 Tax=Acrocarpospora corrugata TaxID=35763 RepID=UPI0012D2DBF1|nr:hypothetical protein [Acrocarpospora corrugata]
MHYYFLLVSYKWCQSRLSEGFFLSDTFPDLKALHGVKKILQRGCDRDSRADQVRHRSQQALGRVDDGGHGTDHCEDIC